MPEPEAGVDPDDEPDAEFGTTKPENSKYRIIQFECN